MKATQSFHSVSKFSIIKIFILLILTFLITTSCDLTDPKKDKPKPEGYQEDIPWPSLADSPWPMFHGNPLGSNRSKYEGPISGIIEWTQDSVFMLSGTVIGKNNMIYGMSQSPEIKAFCLNSNNGDFVWENNTMTNIFSETVTSPIILSNGTIVTVLGTQGDVMAFTPNGEIKWKYKSNNSIWNMGIAVGKDGMIYFTTINSLIAINQTGNLEGSFPINYQINPVTKLIFSPDGKTIYMQGRDVSLISFDVENKNVKWTFGNLGLESYPFVDAQGNIYLLTRDSHSNNKHSLYSLNPDGTIRWAYEHNNSILTESDQVMTMDYEGTTYFAYDSLNAVDYQGKLKWKRAFGGFSSGVLLTDKNNNIYITTLLNNKTNLLSKFDKNGNKIFESQLPVDGMPGFASISESGKMIVTSFRWAINWIYSIK